MPEKILGLDIGAETIKAVQVTAGLKEYDILSARVINVQEYGSTDAALRTLLEDEMYRNNICITSLPVKHFSFRNVTLPFKDRKKIGQTIAFELEPLLPYPLDEATIDYVIIKQQEQSNILAAVIEKSYVSNLFHILKDCQIEATVIDIDPVPVALKLLNSGRAKGCGVLLDVGARDTSSVVFNDGKIVHIRHYEFGGENTTNSIAEILGIRPAEAEKRKRLDRTLTQNSEIARRYRKFLGEINNTLQFLKLRGDTESDISTIFLTGGGAIDQVLQKEIEDFFSITVEPVDIAELENVRFSGASREDWSPMTMSHALALALRQTKKRDGFNYATGEFGAVGKYEKYKKEAVTVAVVVFAALLLFGVDIFIDYHHDRTYLDQIKNQIHTVFKEVAPEVTRIVDPVHQLKGKIADVRKSSQGLGAAGTSVLDTLNAISRLVPKTTDFLITSFTFDGKTVEIKAETDNFNTVDTIKTAFSKSTVFKNVKISSANLIKKGTRVGFDLRMEPG